MSFRNEVIPEKYLALLLKQIKQHFVSKQQFHFSSCYFGGGTPSLLNLQQIWQVQHLFSDLSLSFEEVSIEIHPVTWNNTYLDLDFFNRFSLGVQSLDTEWLNRHNRLPADYNTIAAIVEQIRNKKKDAKINVDLVFETNISIEEFQQIVALAPDSIAAYPLTHKRNYEQIISIYKKLNDFVEYSGQYSRSSPNSFIFFKTKESVSRYAYNDTVLLNQVIGFGHNSWSCIGASRYLSLFENSETMWRFELKENRRFWRTLLFGLPFGISEKLLELTDPNIINFLSPTEDNLLYYLSYDNIPNLYVYLQRKNDTELETLFFNALCFGSSRPTDFPIVAIS